MPVTVTTCLILAAIAIWLWRLEVERALADGRARRRLGRIGHTAERARARLALGRPPAPVVLLAHHRRRASRRPSPGRDGPAP
jgi:hypothetical protein